MGVLTGSRVVLSGTIGQARAPQGERTVADGKEAMPLADAIDKAFELPRGAVLLGNQIRAYGDLRKQLEPALRSALERVALAADEEEKLRAVADVRRIREAIRLGIQEVLKVPPSEPKDASKAGKGNKKADPPKKGADKKPKPAHKDGNKKPNPPRKAEPKKPAEKKAQGKPAEKKGQAKPAGQKKAGADRAP